MYIKNLLQDFSKYSNQYGSGLATKISLTASDRLKKFIACDLKDEFLPCKALALFLQVSDHVNKSRRARKNILLNN